MNVIIRNIASRIALFMIGLFIMLVIAFSIRYIKERAAKNQIHKLLSPGSDAILSAGRDLIQRRHEYAPGDPDPSYRNDAIFLSREGGLKDKTIPEAIRKADPAYVTISSNYVEIVGDCAFSYLIVCKEGALGRGSEMITNGLWIWHRK